MTLRVVSLFAGCGASDVGLYAAAKALGIEVEVIAAYDSWPVAVKTYNANLHPVAQVCDLKTLDSLPDCDLVIGGPPCQDHSMAGKRACRCDKGEEPTPRCCLRDFVRLAGDKPYIMENVVSRLINAPWSEKLCAADFGDVTSRKRWFYSTHLLHVIPTPGPRRIRDIRDHAEDERILQKRGLEICCKYPHTHYDEAAVLNTVRGKTENAPDGRGWEKRIACKAGNHSHYESDGSLGSLTAHARHEHDIRNGKLLGIWGGEEMQAVVEDDAVMATITATDWHGTKNNGSGRPTKGSKLRLGLRGNSASASAFEDDETLGSVLSNSWHGNEASRIVGCRNPSLLEMQRAHSFPESWSWCGATKTQIGQMVANSWPINMGQAVCKAMLSALFGVPQ